MAATGVDLRTGSHSEDAANDSASSGLGPTRVHCPLARRVGDIALAVEVLSAGRGGYGERYGTDPAGASYDGKSQQRTGKRSALRERRTSTDSIHQFVAS